MSVLGFSREKEQTNRIYLFICLSIWRAFLNICLQYGRPGFDSWVGKIPWRRKWLATSIFLPSEFLHGQGSLVGYSSWGCKESDMTGQLTHTHICVKGWVGIEIYCRNWFMQLWCMNFSCREVPSAACCLQIGDPGEPVVWFSLNLKPEKQECQCPRAGEDGCTTFLLCSGLQWMMPTHISDGDHFLLSLLIQMLISSRKTLTNTPRNNVLPIL